MVSNGTGAYLTRRSSFKNVAFPRIIEIFLNWLIGPCYQLSMKCCGTTTPHRDRPWSRSGAATPANIREIALLFSRLTNKSLDNNMLAKDFLDGIFIYSEAFCWRKCSGEEGVFSSCLSEAADICR